MTSAGASTSTDQLRMATHGLRPMAGRDRHESHRSATPLELLFDLAFVIAFSVAGSELAHMLAEGHYRSGLIAFSFAMFAVVWAWINFTWFASAYDTDDWAYRLLTALQMVGVVILALGLPAMFASVDHGDALDIRAMVFGYVVMRVAMVIQWLRAARQDPARSRCAHIYATAISIAQVGWVVVALFDLRIGAAFAAIVPLIALEVAGPLVAERVGDGTPWHPHHIAERYGLLTIIALGEVLLGTVAALSAVLELQGWSFRLALVAVAGVGLMVGMWWVYFLLPAGDILHFHRNRSFGFGYGHFPVFGAIAAVGAGLHVAALYLEHEAHISATAVMWTITIPVVVYFVSTTVLSGRLLGWSASHLITTGLKIAVALAAVALAAAGVAIEWCVAVVALAPATGVIVTELLSSRPQGPRR